MRPSSPRLAREAGHQTPPTPERQLLLMPGELYFGRAYEQISTLLGSCVAVALWHPVHHYGGMCHFILPSRLRKPHQAPEGRFGDEAMTMMMDALARTGSRPSEYQAHLYGGADTMPDHLGVKLNIGERNIELAWTLIEQYGLRLESVDVGDRVPRTVTLDLATGQCRCRRGGGRVPIAR